MQDYVGGFLYLESFYGGEVDGQIMLFNFVVIVQLESYFSLGCFKLVLVYLFVN